MQPNQNMPGAGQAAGPTRPVAPVSPVKPVNPVSPVKPAEPVGGPTFDNGPSVVEGKGGKKTGWIMAVVLLLIVAAGGVGFGVWAWMDGNTQKDALNGQISSLKKQNNELQDQLNNSSTSTDADTADYIYVGEWGLKIKKPEGWRNLISEYSFSNDYPQAVDSLTVKEISDSDTASIFISTSGETSCDSFAVAPDACFEIDGENFTVNIGADVSDALKTYFTTLENYSKI